MKVGGTFLLHVLRCLLVLTEDWRPLGVLLRGRRRSSPCSDSACRTHSAGLKKVTLHTSHDSGENSSSSPRSAPSIASWGHFVRVSA